MPLLNRLPVCHKANTGRDRQPFMFTVYFLEKQQKKQAISLKSISLNCSRKERHTKHLQSSASGFEAMMSSANHCISLNHKGASP